MYQKIPFLTEKLKTAHEDAWRQIAGPGDFFSGEERIEMVRATRDADGCELTIARKNAISPFAVSGEYVGDYLLDSNAIDVIRRIASDPGRLTKAWFDQVIANGLDPEEYVEVVSVVTTSIIIDTLHQALGLAQPHCQKLVKGILVKPLIQRRLKSVHGYRYWMFPPKPRTMDYLRCRT